MKNLKIKFFLVLFVISFNTSAQTIAGDWYTPLRNKLLHINISKDSIIFRKCSFDIEMEDYGYADTPFKIEKVINNNYIVSAMRDSIESFYLLNFKLENGRNNLNIESLNDKFSTKENAENSISTIEKQTMSVTLINKKAIDTIRQQKDITAMQTIDFKNYAYKIIELDSINASNIKKKYKLSYLYVESTSRIVLSNLGFNSLVKGNVYDSMFEKFSTHIETKDLFLKMAGY